jgi:hypothetical protein
MSRPPDISILKQAKAEYAKLQWNIARLLKKAFGFLVLVFVDCTRSRG